MAEGVRLVEEGIHENFPAKFILYTEGLSKRGKDLINQLPPSYQAYLVDSRLMTDLTDTETTQSILAVFDLISPPLPDELDFLLIIDSLRDPGNLGTILRTAEATGVQGVLLAPGTTDAYAPKVVRAGMGAHFRLPIYSLEWDEISEFCSPLTIFCTDMKGEQPYFIIDFRQPCAVVIGSEAEGLSKAARQLAHTSVQIPMLGRSESLNAAAAAAVLLFEVLRQRSLKG